MLQNKKNKKEYYSQLTKRGFLTLPKVVRDSMGWKYGEKPVLKVYKEDNKIIIEEMQNNRYKTNLRVYTDKEVDDFIKQDSLNKKERENAEKYLQNIS